MKKGYFAVLTLALLLVCGSAQAAPYDWTGFYVGLNAGVGINHSEYSLKPSGFFAGDPDNPLRSDFGDFDEAAFTGGAQVGYNYQSNNFVVGVETDFNYNGVDESHHVNRPLSAPLVGRFIHNVTQEVNWFGTLRARLGVATDGWLIYGTGGLAYGHIDSRSGVLFTSAGDLYQGSQSTTRVGWTIGAGTEYAFSNNWSAKMEYLYVDLGDHSYTYGNQLFPGYTYTTDLETREHVIRLGINYKF